MSEEDNKYDNENEDVKKDENEDNENEDNEDEDNDLADIVLDEAKDHGIPCPTPNTILPVEAKAIVLRCVICRSNQIQTVNFPCMHACFCIDCASPSLNHSNTCPQCRTEYMHISMLYLCSDDPTEEDIEPIRKKRKTE